MKILVGLGNPGDKYEMNRHNVGFMAVEAIAENHNAGPWKRRFQGMACEVEVGRDKVLLLKPTTFMNESGRCVGEAIRFYKISPADVIVFHDELDLEPGRVRVKFGGGHAGHNGLKSISAHIGNDYHRVRIGIGHPGTKEAVVAYVLHDFSKKDREWLEPLLHGMARGTGLLLAGQEAKFLNEVARVVKPLAEPAGLPSRKAEATGAVTIKPLVLKELGASEAESTAAVAALTPAAQTAAAASATLATPAPEPAKTAATTSAPAAPAASQASPSQTAASQPAERKPEPAMAETGAAPRGAGGDRDAGPAQTESLAAKLKAWFSRK